MIFVVVVVVMFTLCAVVPNEMMQQRIYPGEVCDYLEAEAY